MNKKIETKEVDTRKTKSSYNAENIKKGDVVLIKNKTYYPVAEVNKETVTIKHWLGVRGFQFKFPYSEIQEVKKPENCPIKVKKAKDMSIKKIDSVVRGLENFTSQAKEYRKKLSADYENGKINLEDYEDRAGRVEHNLYLCDQEVENLKSARARKTLRGRIKSTRINGKPVGIKIDMGSGNFKKLEFPRQDRLWKLMDKAAAGNFPVLAEIFHANDSGSIDADIHALDEAVSASVSDAIFIFYNLKASDKEELTDDIRTEYALYAEKVAGNFDSQSRIIIRDFLKKEDL